MSCQRAKVGCHDGYVLDVRVKRMGARGRWCCMCKNGNWTVSTQLESSVILYVLQRGVGMWSAECLFSSVMDQDYYVREQSGIFKIQQMLLECCFHSYTVFDSD
ncbi:hypothetical protein XENORESO_012456 [Xenotaenia resolanae]|uniref:Uncharacterized protein n=1 Tax=Xenotaenia resolanae TaxID=208358 RepID=A0ABV0VSU9_9TELE